MRVDSADGSHTTKPDTLKMIQVFYHTPRTKRKNINPLRGWLADTQ